MHGKIFQSGAAQKLQCLFSAIGAADAGCSGGEIDALYKRWIEHHVVPLPALSHDQRNVDDDGVSGLRGVVIGAPIGAVVGGCYAAGHLDAVDDFARELTRRRVFGYLDNGVLVLLWWDPDHQVCPMKV